MTEKNVQKLPPEDWVETTLGEVTELISRGITPKYSENEGIVILNQKCIRNWKVSLNESRKTTKFSTEKLLKQFDILVNSTGVGTLGRVAQITDIPFDITVDSHVTIVRPILSEVSAEFLGYKLKQSEKNIEAMAEGSTGQTELSRIKLGNLSFALPCLPEQKAIADVLSAFDDKIELLRAENETLEKLGQTIFAEWFGKYSVHDELPEGWREYQLSELVETINGYSYKGNELAETSNQALVTLKNFDRNGGFQARGFKPFVGIPKVTQEVKIGDLVVAHTDLTQDAEVLGNPAFIFDNGGFEKMYITMDLVKVLPVNSNITSAFLYYLMKSKEFKGHCVGYSNGTTVLHLSKKAIPEYRIILPDDLSKLSNFSELLKETTEKISDNNSQIQSLTRSRDELLPKLMSGEVRVRV